MKHSFVSKLLAAGVAAAMLLTAGCGASGRMSDAGDDVAETEGSAADGEGSSAKNPQEDPDGTEAPVTTESFTYFIDAGEDEYFYGEYEDGPVQKYWMSQVWDVNGVQKKIDVDFIAAPAGSEKDNLNTMLATGEYPDVISLSYSSAQAMELYEQGIALDITDEVRTCMPNYMRWISEHNYENYVTNRIDGEQRFIQLYVVTDEPGGMWGGFLYRRDWLVKYGENPETGEPFSGGPTADGDWQDDVVFPSGETYPLYISDWEWMFEIFEKAIADLGLEEGYAFQLPAQGIFYTGEVLSGFGGGGMYYLDADGHCQFGLNKAQTRANLECFASWYDKGWVNRNFEENVNDVFFSTDPAHVFSGQVGMWYGSTGQIGDGMDVSGGDESDPTCGMMVFGAPQPINDLYGTAAEQGHIPTVYLNNATPAATPVVITDKAADKDIAALLTALDFFYTEDNGMLRVYGFSRDQQEEGLDDGVYASWGVQNGAYEKVEKDGSYRYILNTEETGKADGLGSACSALRIVGQTTNHNVFERNETQAALSKKNWVMYESTGSIPSAVEAQIDADRSAEQGLVQTNYLSYTQQVLPRFITGELNVYDDAVWQEYVDAVDALGVETYCGWIDEITGAGE